MSNVWEIKTETIEDALHFSKIGAYAGFFWCFQTVLGVIIAVFSNPDYIFNSGIYLYFGEKAFVFLFAWILALRVHSGKGHLSAIVLLVSYIGYRILLFIAEPTIFVGFLVTGFMVYAMYAGVLGTQAVRRFSLNKDQDVSVFD